MIRFVRVQTERGPRVARWDGEVGEVLDHDDPLAALRGEGTSESLAAQHLLAPIHAPEVWCAGVTYERSRDARLEEAKTDARDVYALVYEADRPELFMKDANMRRTVGPDGSIRLRSDSSWMVPEPELGLVLGEDGEPVAVTIGNDVSSRDIEGANPLYIPQAKIFAGACAIGPALAVPDDWDAAFPIRMRILAADGQRALHRRDVDRSDEALAPRARGLGDARQPRPSRLRLADGHRPRAAGRLHARAGPHGQIEIDGIGTLSNTVAA